MKTGEKIRKIRNTNKLSQYALAKKTNCLTQSQISKIEKGSRKVTDVDLKIIAKALNVSVSELIN